MTAYPLTPVRYRALDKNGQPLIGGQIFAYEAGSTTSPKDTYSDKSMENLNTWPVVLDDAGSASIYISGDYFFQVFDADGNLIEEGDGIADAESVAQALIDSNSGGASNLEQRVTDLETARDEHTDQINDLIDTTSDLQGQITKEVDVDRDAAIEAAVDVEKVARQDADEALRTSLLSNINSETTARQSAINDLNSRKLDKTGGTVSGDLQITGNVSAKNLNLFGVGQSYQNVTANREIGTTYTNSTNTPIEVHISVEGGSIRNKVYVDNVLILDQMSTYNTGGPIIGSSFTVQSGSTYRIEAPGGLLQCWAELRGNE